MKHLWSAGVLAGAVALGTWAQQPCYETIPQVPVYTETHTETPVDVKPIYKPYLWHAKGDTWSDGQDVRITDHDIYKQRETCADKTRILLHSEDGDGHCISVTAIGRER